ncbi:MAG: hypothetical protein FWG70_04955 [Oscillospiraceae bacterium]|nr:hypothetical protein [Oscillospiraceae bacterium]
MINYIMVLILFSAAGYFLIFIPFSAFYKGRIRTIEIIDKWVKSGFYSSDEYIYEQYTSEPINRKTYIVIYCNYRGKPKKGRVGYCSWSVYDDLEIGEIYLVRKKFKTIVEIL